jgi:ATP-binding cassette subfamily B protein
VRPQHWPGLWAPGNASVSLPGLAARGPGPFLMHYAGRHPGGHILIFASVLAAVCCAIGAQYGVKNLVDVLGAGATTDRELWSAGVLLLALVAGDNLFWRLAGWVAARSFVAVAGDVRSDLFQHLTVQGTRYFADRFPGALAGRIATAGNAAFAIENRLAWNTIPPAAAVLSSIAVLGVVNWRLTVALAAIAAVLGSIIAWLARRSGHLHDRYADRAAAVTGDLADVISNMGLVRAFAAAHRERERLSCRIGHEMSAQGNSLRALERIRLLHAVCVFLVTAAVVVWSLLLWRAGRITHRGCRAGDDARLHDASCLARPRDGDGGPAH